MRGNGRELTFSDGRRLFRRLVRHRRARDGRDTGEKYLSQPDFITP
jgi:hypothetical protein